MAGRISVREVDRLLKENLQLAPAIDCPLNKSAGRVLRENLVADRDLPPYDRIMMDGYAVRGAELNQGAIRIKGQLVAGEPHRELDGEPGSALEVMTGAILPKGVDTVIPYEDTVRDGDRLTLCAKARTGQFVHRKGSDFRAGAILVQMGSIMRAVEAGIAASCGYATVQVSQRPRITVFGTGDELVEVGARPAPHQVRRSNPSAIEHALAMASFHAGRIGHLLDNPQKEEERLRDTMNNSDLVIISGAVSKGKLDWIPAALDRSGTRIFHGVAQKPGGPMGLWITDSGCRVFALPGNPVSTLAGTFRYVIPYLRLQQGSRERAARKVILSQDFTTNGNLTFFLPVVLDPAGRALPRPVNNSGDFARLAGTDGFAELPEGSTQWPAGSAVDFYPWKT